MEHFKAITFIDALEELQEGAHDINCVCSKEQVNKDARSSK